MGWIRSLSLLFAGSLSACAGQAPTGLGVQGGHLAPCPASPNCVSSEASDEGHRIAPLAVEGDPEAAWARLVSVLSARPDTRVVETGGEYLRVEFRTALGFVDDGEFTLDRGGRAIQVRSASRVGYSDLGKNRSRIEEIRKSLAGTPAR